MFGDIRKFVELVQQQQQQSNLDCINGFQTLTSDKNQEPKNYYIDNSICLSELNIPDEFK